MLALMVAGAAAFVPLSHAFSHDAATPLHLIPWMVALLCGLGLTFLAFARMVTQAKAGGSTHHHVLILGLGAGCIIRILMGFSTPVLENDYYRYLWDGAVTASGSNPYGPVPAAVLSGGGSLAELGRQSGDVLLRINHPELRTVYPPVAQVFFALGHLLSPFQPAGLRWILFAAELTTLTLILLLLRNLQLPPTASLLYWLNPVVIKEGSNSLHMDLLLPPFILGALLLAHLRHLSGAVVLLLGAIGIKIWPLILLPLLFRAAPTSRPSQIRALMLALIGCVVLSLPVLAAGLNSSSGFMAYAGRWEMNNGPSLLLIESARRLSSLTHHVLPPRAIFAALVGLALVLLHVVLMRDPLHQLRSLIGGALVLCAGMFLLSPTQFPWYALWFFPLLALQPVPALLVYSLTLPLYYLRFLYQPLGLAPVFDHGVVWIEHGPVVLLLTWAWWHRRHHESTCPSSADAAPSGVPASGTGNTP